MKQPGKKEIYSKKMTWKFHPGINGRRVCVSKEYPCAGVGKSDAEALSDMLGALQTYLNVKIKWGEYEVEE